MIHVAQGKEASMVGDNILEISQHQGNNLMLKRVLLTKCNIQGECCNLIIDGGSTKNLLSLLEKLK